MTRTRLMFTLSAMALTLGAASAVRAGVLQFDDLPTAPDDPGFDDVPNGYGGLNWSNFSYIDSAEQFAGAPGGFTAGVISNNDVIFNFKAEPASITGAGLLPFDFNSAYFTAAWNDNLQVDVTASRNGVTLYSTQFALQTAAPTLEMLNFTGIDTVTFTSSGGTPNANVPGSGTQFVVDNITINQSTTAVPEPASLSLLAVGLVGLMRRKR